MIRAQAYKVSFAGKQDVINAIAEIALEMLEEGGSTLSSEIREDFYWDNAGDAIERIIESLAPEEISILRQDGDLVKESGGLKENATEYGLDVYPPAVSQGATAFGQPAAASLIVG